jgi:hypothetical protein
MNRRSLLTVSFVAASTVALMAGAAIGQQRSLKDQLVGTWMLTSAYNILLDGKRLDANGPSPRGMVVFDAGGRFAEQIIDSTLSKYASNNRQQGTPQDYERVARGVIAFYGTYTVDGDQSITMHVDYSSYPNLNNTDGKREVKITGDELQIVNRSAPSGGAAYLTLKRAK